MKFWYSLDVNNLEELLDSDKDEGLPSNSVDSRLKEYGENKLTEGKKNNLFTKVIKQLKDPTILILIIAALISLAISEVKNTVIILLIVIVNSIIGIIQEQKAEASLASIKKLTSPKAKVIRDKSQKLLDIQNLVPGDLVVLEAGDYVPADMRIINSYDLRVDESSLTGESIPIEKTSATLSQEERSLGDCSNMVFMGSVITYGRAKGFVVDTGMKTQLGKIANMLNETKLELTPLQIKLKELSKILGFIALMVCILIFFIGLIQGQKTYEVFLNAFSLAVASIPEGLPAIVTVVLALGMQVMAKKNAIMRTLPAVETCGAASVICSDKTGTLTQNKMSVTNIYVNGRESAVSDFKATDLTSNKFLTFGVLCNDTLVKKASESFEATGDPTEVALVNLSIYLGLNPLDLNNNYTRKAEIPFDSKRKLMTTVNEDLGGLVTITKGAPEVILSLCHKIEIDGVIKDMTPLDFKRINRVIESMSKRALRILAIGYRPLKSDASLASMNLESNLIFLGLYGIIDPPRPGIKASIDECSKAGIKTVMITGDHETTATAIAKQIGIVNGDVLTVNGKELEKLSDRQLEKKINEYRVFARVSPEHKLRIVKALQKRGNVVVMTGDGVNDAPALKKADIGVSMGITGTEVAKGASDMILADDNFDTIVAAVKYGRVVYSNIRKAVHFLLSGNISEIVSIFLATILGPMIFDMPIALLSAVQILWINLVSDSLLAIALAFENAEPDVMEKKPRTINASILGDGLGIKIIYQGLIIGAITFMSYFIGFKMISSQNLDLALKTGNTMAFMTLAFIQFFHVYNTRSLNNSILKIGVFSNKYLNLAFIVNIFIQLITILIPYLRDKVFNLTMLNPLQWIIVLCLSLLPVIIVEAEKFIIPKLKSPKVDYKCRNINGKPKKFFG